MAPRPTILEEARAKYPEAFGDNSDYLTDDDFSHPTEVATFPDAGWGVNVTDMGDIYISVPPTDANDRLFVPATYDEVVSFVALLRAVTE